MLLQHITLFAILPIFTITWWDVGHMLTATIAEMKLYQMNPYALAHFQDLVTSINHLVDEKSKTFIQAASWPDDIKSSNYNMHLWDAWHFRDQPYVYDGVFPIINFTEVALSSVNVMDQAIKVLSFNLDKNTAERALFARYLVHVAGDIHQPLHSVALFNETFPNGDVGGNKIKVDLLNSTKNFNFHSFWDSGALRIQNDSYQLPRPLTLQNLTVLKEYAQDLISQYGKDVEELGKIISPTKWAFESLVIAKNTTYPFILNHRQISQQYSDLVYDTCKKRVTLAGYRIANLINSIYGDKKFVKDPSFYLEHDEKVEARWNQLKKGAHQINLYQKENYDQI